MATAMTEDGHVGFIFGESFEDSNYVMEYTGMGFLAYSTDYMYFNPPVKFPLTINKISDETISAMSMTKRTAPSKEDILKRKSFGEMKANKPAMLTR